MRQRASADRGKAEDGAHQHYLGRLQMRLAEPIFENKELRARWLHSPMSMRWCVKVHRLFVSVISIVFCRLINVMDWSLAGRRRPKHQGTFLICISASKRRNVERRNAPHQALTCFETVTKANGTNCS